MPRTISAAAAGSRDKTYLADGWTIQSSAKIQAPAATISSLAFQPVDWYKATVPSTVAGNLVDDMVYRDPFFGMNLRSIPGTKYSVGTNFSNQPIPADSPFKASWWYRKEFRMPPGLDGQVWLNFDGINYRANIWLNGKLIADTSRVAGAYRTYTFNVTSTIELQKPNVLAVEVFPPDVNSLAVTWVDWNPMPPDKNMGLWRDVYVTATGPVALRYPQVLTKVDLPALEQAHLIVSAELENPGDRALKATLKGGIEGIRFEQTVELAAHERRRVEFTPTRFAQLNLSQPRLWWPIHAGPQNLYDLNLEVSVDGKTSDQDLIRFGIREATSELNDKGYRVFKINGRPILVRGGGWAPDMFLRPSAEREAAEIRYVKDMNLNAIRFEGKTERGRFLEMCDREGIMVIAGWCCCDYWERWSQWKDNDYDIATESLRDQIRRIRNHPCIITFWYGSDGPPNARAERNYLAVLKELNWPNSAQASATARKPAVGEPTGIRMTGPYEYVPPVYWYVDTDAGGAYCFNTETSPGPAVPPIESLRRMLPKEHLWPIDEFWNYHAGGGPFKSLGIFTEALNTASRRGEERRGLRDEGTGDGVRRRARHVRGLRAQQVRFHGRHPVDDQQRLALDDLAPLRLLPAAGRRLLRYQESLRAIAHPVFLRQPVDRGGEQLLPRIQGAGRLGGNVQPRHDQEVFQAGAGGYHAGRQTARLSSARTRRTDLNLFREAHARGRLGPTSQLEFLLAVDAARHARRAQGRIELVLQAD